MKSQIKMRMEDCIKNIKEQSLQLSTDNTSKTLAGMLVIQDNIIEMRKLCGTHDETEGDYARYCKMMLEHSDEFI